MGAELTKEFGVVAKLIESGGGVYEVVVNNNLVFSKKQLNRFPNTGEIVELIIKYWGSGSIKVKKNKKFYEHHYLQLDIKKAKKYLKWKPTYDAKESVNVTVDWYYRVLNNKENPIMVTNEQIDQYMYDNN